MQALLSTLLSSLAVANAAQQILQASTLASCKEFKSYTALGDSYAGGFGSDTRLKLCGADLKGFGIDCTTLGCGQDIGAYSWHFAKDNSISSFQYLACNGNDTGSIIDSQINTVNFGQPDVVTVNMGGDNNSFFARVVKSCMVLYDHALCEQALYIAKSVILDLDGKYDRVFAAIKAKVQTRTKVVAMSYARLWGNVDYRNCSGLLNIPSVTHKRTMNQLALAMNHKLKASALKAGYLYADVDAAFEGERLCDRTGADGFKSWFQLIPKFGNDTGGQTYYELSFAHPTEQGQQAMLTTLYSALQCQV